MNPSPDYQNGRDAAHTLDDLGHEPHQIRLEAIHHTADFRMGMMDVAHELETERLGAV